MLDTERTSSSSEAVEAKAPEPENPEGDAAAEEGKDGGEADEKSRVDNTFDIDFGFSAKQEVSRAGRTAFIDTIYNDKVRVSVIEAGDEEVVIGTVAVDIAALATGTTEVKGWYPLSLSAKGKAALDRLSLAPGVDKAAPQVQVSITCSSPLLSEAEVKVANVLDVEIEEMVDLPVAWRSVPEGKRQSFSFEYRIPPLRRATIAVPSVTTGDDSENNGDARGSGANDDDEEFKVVSEEQAPNAQPRLPRQWRRFYLSGAAVQMLQGQQTLEIAVTGTQKGVEAEEDDWSQSAKGCLSLRKLLRPGATTIQASIPVRGPPAPKQSGESDANDDAGKDNAEGEAKDEPKDPFQESGSTVKVRLTLRSPLVPPQRKLSIANVLPDALRGEPGSKQPIRASATGERVFEERLSRIGAELRDAAAGLGERGDDAKNICKTGVYQTLKRRARDAIIAEIQRQYRWKRAGITSVLQEQQSSSTGGRSTVPAEEVRSVLARLYSRAMQVQSSQAPAGEKDLETQLATLRRRARDAEAEGDRHRAQSLFLSRIALVEGDDNAARRALCWVDLGGLYARGVGSTVFQSVEFGAARGASPPAPKDSARECFRIALESDSQCVPALLGMGSLMCEVDEVEVAIEYLTRAEKALPSSALVQAVLYVAWDLLEDDARADANFANLERLLADGKGAGGRGSLAADDWDVASDEDSPGAWTGGAPATPTQFLLRYFSRYLNLVTLPLHVLGKVWSPNAAAQDDARGGRSRGRSSRRGGPSEGEEGNSTPSLPKGGADAKANLEAVAAWAGTARTWLRSGKINEGLALLRSVASTAESKARLGDDSAAASAVVGDALAILGVALGEAGRVEEAERALLRAINSAPSMNDARRALADLYIRSGKGDKAVPVLRDVVRRAEAAGRVPSAYTLARLAWALVQDKKLSEAERVLSRATESDPGAPLVWSVSCLLAVESGARQEARDALETALECKTLNPSGILEEIAAACSGADGFAGVARRALSRASLVGEVSPRSALLLAEVCAGQGDAVGCERWAKLAAEDKAMRGRATQLMERAQKGRA